MWPSETGLGRAYRYSRRLRSQWTGSQASRPAKRCGVLDSGATHRLAWLAIGVVTAGCLSGCRPVDCLCYLIPRVRHKDGAGVCDGGWLDVLRPEHDANETLAVAPRVGDLPVHPRASVSSRTYQAKEHASAVDLRSNPALDVVSLRAIDGNLEALVIHAKFVVLICRPCVN